MRRGLLVLLPLIVVMIAVAVWTPTGVGATGDRPRVVTTIPPVATLIRDLVGDAVVVDGLVPPGASPHLYQLTPSQARDLQHSALVVGVGPELDGWLLGAASAPLWLLDCVPDSHRRRWACGSGCAHHHDHGHDHGAESGIDPHCWLDPVTVGAALPRLVDGLAAALPDQAAAIRQRATVLAEQLQDLHADFSIELLPLAGVPVVTHHPSFGYLIDRYGLQDAGALLQAAGAELRPQQLVALRHRVQTGGIQVLFSEPQLDQAPARAAAEACGVPLVLLDPLAPAPSFPAFLRSRVDILRQALQP